MDASQYSRGIRALPRQTDRRRITALKGVPLLGGLGLVLNDRRSHRERRRSRRALSPEPPCALLQRRERTSRASRLFRGIGLPWRSVSLGHASTARQKDLPWLLHLKQPAGPGGLARIGAWLKRCLKYPW